MDEMLAVEPFGFFTLESLRAGWYLTWRQLVRIVPVAAVGLLIGSGLGRLGLSVLGGVVSGLGVLAALIWAIVLLPRLASQWAEGHYGYPLTGQARVWWAIVWRACVAGLIASVILTPPTMVAASLSIAFQESPLGGLGKLLMALLVVVNGVVTVLTTGWAMSKVASTQLSGLPLTSLPFEPAETEPTMPSHADELEAPLPVAMPEPVAVPVAVASSPAAVAPTPRTAVAAVSQAAPSPAAAGARRQCPKCGLSETERGTIIGWYCTICGWREARR